MAIDTAPPRPHIPVLAALKKYWGYDGLRPLQAEAIEAGLRQDDSLVVLPTGGGKSLCYQVPPLVAGRTDIVVSPLISLMKDQVDALKACGYPATALHSGLDARQRAEATAGIAAGKYRLVFVAPERLLSASFLALVDRLDVKAFAIDEAHCISQWGYDFRPEYRRLAQLRERFPSASFHAYTATATPRVRADIIDQLGLRRPRVLVGSFDRPNLVYRIVPRGNLDEQVMDAVQRHAGEAVIVYCISRRDTELMAAMLQERGVRAAAYHAGLDPLERTRTQEAFALEKIDVVVATVAFGMGIDRSNVRCVIHAAMPKSVEHYQQETGRAGRDGLEAECVLFHSPGDFRRWESILRKGGAESGQPAEVIDAQLALLSEMQNLAGSNECRHRALSRYFGQEYPATSCKACDVCLSEGPELDGADEIARKVVACVEHLGMAFGVGYVVEVLAGAKSARVERWHHERLPEYGALAQMPREALRDAVFQLIAQGVLARTDDDMPVVKLTARSRDVLSGRLAISLRPHGATAKKPSVEDSGWEGVDGGLFEKLREERRAVALEQNVPAFVVFSDATLRELARVRPVSLESFGRVKGIGERKLADLGARFVETIATHCREHRLPVDAEAVERPREVRHAGNSIGKRRAFDLFERGASLEEVAQTIGRARSTVASYLEDYVGERKPESVDAWVAPEVYKRVDAAAQKAGGSLLRPVFERLGGEIEYDVIRIVMRHARRR